MNLIETEHSNVLLQNKSGMVTFPNGPSIAPIEVYYILENGSLLLFSLNSELHSTSNLLQMSVTHMPDTPESSVLHVHGERFLVQTANEISEAKRKFHDRYKTVFPGKKLYCVKVRIKGTELGKK